MTGKPTVADLGVDLAGAEWKGSGEGPGTIEVAFVRAHGQDWVLLRIRESLDGLVSVFSTFEWKCFIDGAKKGEFDRAPG
jgi:hypothetical protein